MQGGFALALWLGSDEEKQARLAPVGEAVAKAEALQQQVGNMLGAYGAAAAGARVSGGPLRKLAAGLMSQFGPGPMALTRKEAVDSVLGPIREARKKYYLDRLELYRHPRKAGFLRAMGQSPSALAREDVAESFGSWRPLRASIKKVIRNTPEETLSPLASISYVPLDEGMGGYHRVASKHRPASIELTDTAIRPLHEVSRHSIQSLPRILGHELGHEEIDRARKTFLPKRVLSRLGNIFSAGGEQSDIGYRAATPYRDRTYEAVAEILGRARSGKMLGAEYSQHPRILEDVARENRLLRKLDLARPYQYPASRIEPGMAASSIPDAISEFKVRHPEAGYNWRRRVVSRVPMDIETNPDVKARLEELRKKYRGVDWIKPW